MSMKPAKQKPSKQLLVSEMRKSLDVLHEFAPQLTGIENRMRGILEGVVFLLEIHHGLREWKDEKEKHDV